MLKKRIGLVVMALILTACSTQAPTTPVQVPTPTSIAANENVSSEVKPSPQPSLEPTSAVSPTAEIQATETSPAEDPASPAEANTITYKIVPSESQVSYEIGEVFINQGNVFNTAVGVTKQVEGEVTIDKSNLQNSSIGTITVDISQFKSDSNRRDNAIRGRWLESSAYPIATFVPTNIDGLPASGQEGVEYPLKIAGDLTVRQQTKPVTFDALIQLNGDTLSGTATTTILLSDFNVGPIDMAGILKTEDQVKLTLQFTAKP